MQQPALWRHTELQTCTTGSSLKHKAGCYNLNKRCTKSLSICHFSCPDWACLVRMICWEDWLILKRSTHGIKSSNCSKTWDLASGLVPCPPLIDMGLAHWAVIAPTVVPGHGLRHLPSSPPPPKPCALSHLSSNCSAGCPSLHPNQCTCASLGEKDLITWKN